MELVKLMALGSGIVTAVFFVAKAILAFDRKMVLEGQARAAAKNDAPVAR